MNILLLGMIGAGKSTIAKALAKELDYTLVELDQLVLENTGYKNVQEVYANRVSLWKESELAVMQRLSRRTDQVIACGGGIVENDLNFQYFRENSEKTIIIYLAATEETLAKRLVVAHPEYTLDEQQKVQANIATIFPKRDTLSRLVADVVIETDDKIPADVITQIMATVRK